MFGKDASQIWRFIALPRSTPKLLLPPGSIASQVESFILYSPGSKKGKALKNISKLTAKSGALNLFALLKAEKLNKIKIPDTLSTVLTKKTLKECLKRWSAAYGKNLVISGISIGTASSYQKAVVLLYCPDLKTYVIAKIGQTKGAKSLIRHESRVLDEIRSYNLHTLNHPHVVDFTETDEYCSLMQTVLNTGNTSKYILNHPHFEFLAEIANNYLQKSTLNNCTFWEALSNELSHETPIIELKSVEDVGFLTGICRELSRELNRIAETSWPLIPAHGDFIPWNIKIDNNKLAIYDWEFFMPLAPAGWDIIRFYFMIEFLINGKRASRIYAEMINGGELSNYLNRFENMTGIVIPDRGLLFKLFLADLATDFVRKTAQNYK